MLGIRGRRASLCDCPIARYLAVHGIAVDAIWSMSGVVSMGAREFAVLPRAVRTFVFEFDNGMHRDLETYDAP